MWAAVWSGSDHQERAHLDHGSATPANNGYSAAGSANDTLPPAEVGDAGDETRPPLSEGEETGSGLGAEGDRQMQSATNDRTAEQQQGGVPYNNDDALLQQEEERPHAPLPDEPPAGPRAANESTSRGPSSAEASAASTAEDISMERRGGGGGSGDEGRSPARAYVAGAPKSPRAPGKRVAPLHRELAALYEPNALTSRPRVVSKPGRTTNNSQSQFFLGQHGSSSGDEQLLSPGQAGAVEASTGSPTLLDEGLHGDDGTTTTIAATATSTSTKASAGSGVAPGLNGDRLEAAKKQFISLACSFTSPDELSAFSLFAAHVLYQQRAVLAKGPSTGSSVRRSISIPHTSSSSTSSSQSSSSAAASTASLRPTGSTSSYHAAAQPTTPQKAAPPSPDRRGMRAKSQQQQPDSGPGSATKKRPRTRKNSVNIGGSGGGGGVVAKREDYGGGGAASGSDAELESDGEFDPAPRIKGGKRGGQLAAPKRAKRKRTRTDANAETLRSAISEVCDIDLKGIINDEVFEKEFTAEEKDRLMLLLPEVDRRDPQTLAQCLRFNTHLNVAMQQYQQIQRAGQLEESDDAAAFVARPQRPLDPWKAKYFEEYWGQRLGLPPPPPVRGTSQADIEAELPPLTPTNQAQLAFSYSAREPHHHQKPLPTQRHASPAAHSVSNHHRLPGGSSCAYDAEAVPPRKRKLEPSPSLEDRATVHSGPPSPAQAEDEGQWQRQPRRHAEGHEEDDAAYMDDEAATGGKPGSLTKRRRVRSTTALPEGGAHPGSASADDRVMSGRSGSGSGASPSSSSRTRYVSSSSSSANGRASSHLPPKKSHKQNVGGGGHRPRASSSSSPTVNSTRQTEQEILEEFNLSGEGGGLDYEADVVDDEPNSDVSPRGAKKRAAADRDPRRRKEREKREGSVAAAAGGSSASAAGGVKKKGSGGSGSSGGGGGGGVKLKDPASGNDLTSGASFRRGAEIILKREGKPMDAREIVRVGLKEGLFSTKGKTPQNTLASLLYMDIKNNRQSIFVKVKPMTFGLKEFDPSLLNPE